MCAALSEIARSEVSDVMSRTYRSLQTLYESGVAAADAQPAGAPISAPAQQGV
jgi:hypothetical protein